MVKRIALAALLFLLCSRLLAAEASKAKVALTKEGQGTATVGGVTPNFAAQTVEFEFDKPYDCVVKVGEGSGVRNVSLVVKASCGVNIISRNKVKKSHTSVQGADPGETLEDLPWKNRGSSFTVADADASDGGSSIGGAETYPQNRYEGVTEIIFQRARDVPTRSGSGTDPNNSSYNSGNAGTGGGPSAAPGQIMGYPDRLARASVFPAEPVALVDGVDCCGGVSGMAASVEVVETSTLRNPPKMGYDISLGGYIEPHADGGMSYGHIRIALDVMAPAGQFGSLLASIAKVQRIEAQVEPFDHMVGAHPFVFIMVPEGEQFTVRMHQWEDVYTTDGINPAPVAVPLKRYVFKRIINGGTRLIAVSHYDGNSTAAYQVNQFVQSGVSSSGWTQEWVLNWKDRTSQMLAFPSATEFFRTSQRWTIQGTNLWLPQESSLFRYRIEPVDGTQSRIFLDEETTGLGRTRERNEYDYGTFTVDDETIDDDTLIDETLDDLTVYVPTDVKTYAWDTGGVEYLQNSERLRPFEYGSAYEPADGPYTPWLNDTGDDAAHWKLWTFNAPSQDRRLVHSSLPFSPQTSYIPSIKWQDLIESTMPNGGNLGTREAIFAFGRSAPRYRYSIYQKKAVGVQMDVVIKINGQTMENYPPPRYEPGDLMATYDPSGRVTEMAPPAHYPSVGDGPVDATLCPARFAPYEKAVTIQNQRLTNPADGSTLMLVSYSSFHTNDEHPLGSKVHEPWKTTQSTVVTGKAGIAFEKEEVWNGSGWQLITTTSYTYDADSRLVSMSRDGAVVQTISYTALNGGGLQMDVTDVNGVVTRWISDPLTNPETVNHPLEQRLSRSAHPSSPWEAQAQIESSEAVQYTADGSNHITGIITTRTQTAGGLTLSSSAKTDVGGTMIESTDEAGVVTTYGRSYASGYLTETRTTGGRSYSTTRYLDGQLRATGGSGQHATTHTYAVQLTGGEGVKETESLPEGLVNTRLRTADGEIKEEVVDGVKTVYDYDAAGRVIKKTIGATDPKVYLMSYDYRDIVIKEGWDMNHDGQLSANSTDTLTERDHYYKLEQNQLWLVTEESVYTQTGSTPEKLTTKRREAQGMGAGAKTWITYPNGAEEMTTLGVTTNGVTTETTTSTAYPNLSKVSTYYYGRLVAFKDYGITSPIRYRYDAFGRQTHVIDPRSTLAQVTAYHATTGRVTSSTNAAGEATKYGYQSADGLLDWTDNAANVRTDYTWNTRGLLTSVGEEGAGSTYPVSYQYTATGKLERIATFVPGDERSLTWSSGRLTGRTFGGNAGSVSYLYWPDGLVKQRQWGLSPNALTTLYTYDSAGHLVGVNHDDATPDVTYGYDRAGRLSAQTDGSGQRSFEYEADGTVTETVSSGLLSGLSITKRVNAAGQTTALEWGFAGVNGKVGYAYADGRLASASLLASSASPPTQPLVTASYDYHPNSAQVHHLTRPIADGLPLVGTFTLDAVGRSDVITWQRGTTPAFEEIDYTLNNAGRRWKEARKDGTTLEYSYNSRGELSGVVRRQANGGLREDWTHAYEYDEGGNRTLTATPEGETQHRYPLAYPRWVQNPARRSWLRGRAHPQAVVTVNGTVAGRDGELWRARIDLPNGKAVETTVSASRPDLSPAPPAVVQTRRVAPAQGVNDGVGSARINHDSHGNIADDGRWTYQWDAERRPVIMEERFLGLVGETQRPVKRLEMIYDAQGRRVSKKVLTNTRNANGTLVNTAWTFESEALFLWQDWTLIAEFVRLTASGTPQLRRTYLWGLDVNGTLGGAGGVGGLLWVADHVPDQTGSNRQLAPWYDGNGNILGWMENEGAQILPLHRLEYAPFGKTLVDDPVRVARTKKQRDLNVPNDWLDRPPFGFSTKYEDRETGLLYYGFRYYSPELGRWISRDPINERGGFNIYGMVGNDPVNQIDLLGLSGWRLRVNGKATDTATSTEASSGDLFRIMGALTRTRVGTADWTPTKGQIAPVPANFLVNSETRYPYMELFLVTKSQRDWIQTINPALRFSSNKEPHLVQRAIVHVDSVSGEIRLEQLINNTWNVMQEGPASWTPPGQPKGKAPGGSLASQLKPKFSKNSAGKNKGKVTLEYSGSGGWDDEGYVDHVNDGIVGPDEDPLAAFRWLPWDPGWGAGGSLANQMIRWKVDDNHGNKGGSSGLTIKLEVESVCADK